MNISEQITKIKDEQKECEALIQSNKEKLKELSRKLRGLEKALEMAKKFSS